MAQQFQFRGGAAALWAEVNPILADREMGIETDTRKFKIGDGVTHWNNLSYATQGNSGTITIGAIETVDPGTPASVKNVGTPTAAILNFKIPKGDIGVTGFTGQAFSGDFHEQLTAGYYYTAAAGQANAPNSTEKFMLIIAVGENTNYVIHKATAFTSGKQYINVKTAGVWNGWALLTTAADVTAFSQTVRMWQKNTPYVVGEIAYSANLPSWARVECTAGGTTAATEPTWPTKAGQTVTDGAVTWTIRDVRNGRIMGVENHIVSGRKITSTSGLVANLSAGKECINGYISELDANAVTLPARKACLICDKADGSTVVVEGKYPTDYIDDNTIGMWIFNQAAGVNVPNSAVGKSAIAVANDMVPTGGITPVDGHCDYAAKLDGSTGFFKASNTTNFPSGAAELEETICLTVNRLLTAQQWFLSFGTASGNQEVGLTIAANTGNLIFSTHTTVCATPFYVEAGKTYDLTVKYNGTTLYILVNGVQVFSVAITLATVLTYSLFVGSYVGASINGPAAITVHYVELRNKMRSDAKTAEISNKMMLPCFYTKTAAAYPTIPAVYTAACHEYRFDETSGTTVADSNTTSPLNGTAIGTTIADSLLELGKSRKFNGTSDKITLGSFTCGSMFSFGGVVNIPSYSNQPPLWSNRNSGGTSGNLIYIDSSGYLCFHNGTKYILWNTPIPLNTPLFIAVSISGTTADVYIGSATKMTTAAVGALNTTENTAYLCYDAVGQLFNGIADYMMFGNFALTAADVKQIYNALMATGRRSIIDDVVPSNAVAVAYAKTGSSGVLDYNDLWYCYGRREGAVGGNRKFFLQYVPVVLATDYSFANPFNTENVTVKQLFKKNLSDKQHTEIEAIYSVNYGSAIKKVAADKITIRTGEQMLIPVTISYTGSQENSGYIGLLVEIAEDYTGVA